MTKQINTKQFNEEVLQGKGLTVVDFFATWCGPCKMLTPILEEISREEERINIVSIDIDEENILAAKEGIMSVPTLQVYKDGRKVDQIIGLMPKNRIMDKLSKHLD